MYKIGDVVILKSGGPEMTVARLIDNETILCEWFPSAELAPMSKLFAPDALKNV